MDIKTQQQFDRMVADLLSGGMNRREFFRRGAVLGVSLATVTEVLSATKQLVTEAQAAYDVPADWNPYPFKWGMDPIASTPEQAIDWWLARMKDSSAPDTDPSAV